jgi:hypothetical protein
MAIVFGNGSGDFVYISVIYIDHIPKYNSIAGIFRKITVHALGAPQAKCQFS